MRKPRRALVALSFMLAATTAQADTVTLAADEWCPYNCAPGSDRPGYMIEIAARALARGGHRINYVVMPWSRALVETKTGRLDGAVGAATVEFPDAVYPKHALGRSGNVLAMNAQRAKDFTYTGVESLTGLRIGAARNYSYDSGPIDAYLAATEASGLIEFLSGTEVQSQNLRKLLAGRVDAVIENDNVMRLAIAEIQPRPHIALISVGSPTDVSIAFSPAKSTSAHYAALIDETLVELRRSGELAALLARYNLTDWER